MFIKYLAIKYKSTLTALLLIFLCLPWSSNASQRLFGEIDNTESDQIVLYEFFGSQSIPMDTVAVKNGKYEFKYKESLPRGFYRIGFDQGDARVLIVADEDIELNGSKGKMSEAEIKGSRENEIFKEYQQVVSQVNQGVQNINSRVSKARSELSKDPVRFEEELNSIRKDFDTLVKWQHRNYRAIAEKYPETYVGKISNYFARVEGESADSYLGLKDLNDPELIRGDMFKTKYIMYYQQYLGSNFQNLKAQSQKIIQTDLDPRAKEVLYAAIIESFAQADQNFAGKIAKAYFTEFPKSDIAQTYYSSLPQGPPDIGDEAPDIILKNPEGEDVSLSSLKGKVVLLDFWASWCGPCRRENPNVVKTYHEYKDQGFTVYSVSLDNNREKWVDAIAKDGLIWNNHVSDLKGWQSSGAALYGVRSIPSTFLLDENGVIVAKNLRGSSLETKLQEIFGAN